MLQIVKPKQGGTRKKSSLLILILSLLDNYAKLTLLLLPLLDNYVTLTFCFFLLKCSETEAETSLH